jgi:glycosyltransferase 2 family protein
MKPTWKHIAITLLKFLIPIAIVGWLLWRIENEQWTQLVEQPKNFPLLGLALLVAMLSIVVSMLRWGLLVRCNGIRLGYVESLRLGSIGFLLSFVSAGSVGGDLFKAIFLARRNPGKGIEAVASVAVDRGVGLYGLLIVAVAILMVAPPRDGEQMQVIARSAAVLTVLGTVLLAALIFGGKTIDGILKRLGNRRWIGGVVRKVADPLRVFHTHPVQFFWAIAMSIGVHVLLAFSINLIAVGLFADAPSLSDHMIIVPLAMLVSALPLSPAGIGLLEVALQGLYEVVPAEPTAASGTLVALVFEVVKITLAVAGMVFYWTSGSEVKASLENASEIPSQNL